MDQGYLDILEMLLGVLPFIAVIVVAAVAGSLFNTWIRIRNGYPLQNSWGMPLHPKSDREQAERITLLTNENAQLRAEIGSIKDRLATVERIVTDEPARLGREIDALVEQKGGRA
ncbi:hypothetical protein H8M03_01600 [Sphingomonas sabuli]|uniref:Uncharacterized protein n=1 Tax=Sphingomonas sabuli TaxID=2764186 RepID=A0A7G9L384_9SPHN|nr:hypothetical protein [Sphingomonas sabuli]QNM83083.1 hypothetical protein H8M03_01600 [Sphingomonas sabuli]